MTNELLLLKLPAFLDTPVAWACSSVTTCNSPPAPPQPLSPGPPKGFLVAEPIRQSPSYELRLDKYSRRLGLSILVPGMHPMLHEQVIDDFAKMKVGSGSSGRTPHMICGNGGRGMRGFTTGGCCSSCSSAGCCMLQAAAQCWLLLTAYCCRCRCCCLRYRLLPPLHVAMQASVQESVSWMVRLGNTETRVQMGRRGRRSRARHGEQLWGQGSKRGAAWGNGLGAERDGRGSLGMDRDERYILLRRGLARMLLWLMGYWTCIGTAGAGCLLLLFQPCSSPPP